MKLYNLQLVAEAAEQSGSLVVDDYVVVEVSRSHSRVRIGLQCHHLVD